MSSMVPQQAVHSGPSLRATPVRLAWGGPLPPRTPMLPGYTSLSCSELLTLQPSLSPPSSLSGLTHLSVALKIPIEHRQHSWPECVQEELTSTLKAPPWGRQERGQGRGAGTHHIFLEVGSSAAVPRARKTLGLEPIRHMLPLSLQLPSLTTHVSPELPTQACSPFQASASATKWPQWAPLPYFPGAAPMLRSLCPRRPPVVSTPRASLAS